MKFENFTQTKNDFFMLKDGKGFVAMRREPPCRYIELPLDIQFAYLGQLTKAVVEPFLKGKLHERSF